MTFESFADNEVARRLLSTLGASPGLVIGGEVIDDDDDMAEEKLASSRDGFA